MEDCKDCREMNVCKEICELDTDPAVQGRILGKVEVDVSSSGDLADELFKPDNESRRLEEAIEFLLKI